MAIQTLLQQSNISFGQIEEQHSDKSFQKQYHDKLEKLLTIHYSIDHQINLILQSMALFQERSSTNDDSIVIFRNNISKFLRENLAITEQCETILLLSSTPYSPGHLHHLKNLIDRRYALNLHFNPLITFFLPGQFRKDFQSLYINLIKPLDQYVVTEKKDTYLIANLGKFNNLWNNFHMKITKSAQKPDKYISETIASMHRHWNNLLKILLRHQDKGTI